MEINMKKINVVAVVVLVIAIISLVLSWGAKKDEARMNRFDICLLQYRDYQQERTMLSQNQFMKICMN